jgi:hypothetical protein
MVARNLSLGGLYCTSTADFAEMTRLAVRLLLPARGATDGETEQVDLEAVVVRREPMRSANGQPSYELALYFTNLGPETRDRIERFLGDRSH